MRVELGGMTGESAGTVGVVGSARELGVLTDGHLHHALVPALDHALADDELERSAAILEESNLLPSISVPGDGRVGGRGEVRVGGKRAGTGAYGRSGSSDR